MYRKYILLILAVAAGVLVFVVAVKTHKKDPSIHNATVRYIKAGHTGIACEDARWLTDIFSQLIDENTALIEKYEKPFLDNDTPIPDEALSALRREMEQTPSQARIKFEQWQSEIQIFINDTYKGDTDTLRDAEDALGADVTELYYLVSGIKFGLLSETETLKTIEERYCSDVHIH